jgi:hypothetical protein
MTGRDYQRSRVYDWEGRVVVPYDRSHLAIAAAQPMVDAIWTEMGLLYPPRVEPLPAVARRRLADANRLTIRLPALVPSWCLLHELAHAMTSDHDGRSDGHGPLFMAVYVQLLSRYMRLDAGPLRASAAARGIRVALEPKPSFVSGACPRNEGPHQQDSGLRRRGSAMS